MYQGKENAQTAQWILAHREPCIVVGFGDSMTPILKSGQPVVIEPIAEETVIKKHDIVFCKVNGHYYLHKVLSIKNGKRYMIGNNHGHVNGTITIRSIFGKVVKIL